MGPDSLSQIDSEELFFFREDTYTSETKTKLDEVFKKLFREGKIYSCSFASELWPCTNGVEKVTINFSMSRILYDASFGKKFNVHYSTISKMIRYYALSLTPNNIFRTISNKINTITDFLTHYGRTIIQKKRIEINWILRFLDFIGLSGNIITEIQNTILSVSESRSSPRTLSDIINYYVIHDAVNEVSERGTDEFIRWFPVFIWCNVSFVIPLRPTELLVTPFDCISKDNGNVYLTLRRTKLKGNKITVHHDLKDYKFFRYRVPNEKTIQAIEKYQQLTGQVPRRFLFSFSEKATNEMLSLDKFNELIEEFIVLHIVGNHKYDYARFASGIKEFEIVNAGDSRHLALSNMFCQGVDLDICRQLADHTDLTTTAGYCTNILNTLESSSIMKIQRELYNKELILHSYEYRYPLTNQNHISCCSSPEQPHKTGNVLPCIKENHLETCIGCQYYTPSASELTKELETRRKKLLSASKTVVKCLIHKRDLKIDDMDKLFLDAHAAVTRYQIACNEKTKEVKEKWLAQQNIQKMTS